MIFGFGIFPADSASPPVRIKDISHILEARENQLMGFGLVVGLSNTGDTQQTGFTQQAMTNLLSKMGMMPQGIDFKSRNVAAVMVTAKLPAYVKSGQKLDVTVASMGDATSLQGGMLLTTPLSGVDEKVYAVAQGNVLVGAPQVAPTLAPIRKSKETAGTIPGGALVEKEVPITFAAQNEITIVIDHPDNTTANRMVQSISRAGVTAWAEDAGTVKVSAGGSDLVGLMARIENLTLVPDTAAKVVISERTGTIVIGENVRLAPFAVSFGGIQVTVNNLRFDSDGTDTQTTSLRTHSNAQILKRESAGVRAVPQGPTLGALVRALNTIRANPSDLVGILQAIKKAGALNAELEVM